MQAQYFKVPLGLAIVWSFSASATQDRIIISGMHLDSGTKTCGLFELDATTRVVKPVLLSEDCRCAAWLDLNLSPDGKHAIAHRTCMEGLKDDLELIDLIAGTMSPLGEHLWKAAFSPDGKWIAALENGPRGISKTVLIDRNDRSRRRELGGTSDVEAVWSPDSRYILHVNQTACAWQHPLSLEVIDIQGGKRSIVPNSECKVPSHFIGWVSNEVGEITNLGRT